jgi:F-type H+-transporting ATPase subunit a
MFFLAAADDPTGHSKDIFLIKIGETPVLTMHMVTLVVAAGLFLWLMNIVATAMQTGPASQGNERFITKGRFAQMIEAMICWLRDEIIEPILGKKTTRSYLPYLLTVFFFIWFNNILGLIPLLDLQHLIGAIGWGDDHFAVVGGTATGNLAVTGALAIIAGFVIVIHGLRDLGPKEFFYHLCGGLLPCPPLQAIAMSPIILLVLLIELLGLLIKPTALALRLFANMLAGHTLLATLLLFTYMAAQAGMGFMGVAGVAAISGAGAVAIYFLEIFVATLQAFIFMFLTTVFISLFTHHDEHEHEHEHDEMAATDVLQEPTAA